MFYPCHLVSSPRLLLSLSPLLISSSPRPLSSGKWAYEVLISSQGLMQIGWCTLNCRFNQEVSVCVCLPVWVLVSVWNSGK